MRPASHGIRAVVVGDQSWRRMWLQGLSAPTLRGGRSVHVTDCKVFTSHLSVKQAMRMSELPSRRPANQAAQAATMGKSRSRWRAWKVDSGLCPPAQTPSLSPTDPLRSLMRKAKRPDPVDRSSRLGTGTSSPSTSPGVPAVSLTLLTPSAAHLAAHRSHFLAPCHLLPETRSSPCAAFPDRGATLSIPFRGSTRRRWTLCGRLVRLSL
jgi:hypothetical protein